MAWCASSQPAPWGGASGAVARDDDACELLVVPVQQFSSPLTLTAQLGIRRHQPHDGDAPCKPFAPFEGRSVVLKCGDSSLPPEPFG